MSFNPGKRFLFCFYFIFFCSSNILLAQDYTGLKFRKLGFEEGLPVRKINAIVQDQNGFFWLACSKGLLRYDGTNFIGVEELGYLKNGLQKCATNDLWLDDNNGIWLATDCGLYVIESSRKDVAKISLKEVCATSLCTDEKITKIFSAGEFLLIANAKGYVFKVEKTTRKPSLLFTPENFPTVEDKEVYDVCLTSDSTLYILFRNGFVKTTVKKGVDSRKEMSFSLNPKGKKGLRTVKIKKVICYENQIYFAASLIKIYKSGYVNVAKDFFKHYARIDSSLFTEQIKFVKSMHHNMYLVATYEGKLFIWDLDKRIFQAINPDDNYYENTREINDILRDHNGNVWLATNNGLFKGEHDWNSFKPILKASDERNNISVRDVFQVTEKHVLIGTYRKTYLMNLETNTLCEMKVLIRDNGREWETGIIQYEIYNHEDGNLYLCSESFGIYIVSDLSIDKKEIRLTKVIVPDNMGMYVKLKSLNSLTHDILLGGGEMGLYELNLAEHTLKKIAFEDSLSNEEVFVLKKNNKKLWVGSKNGLFEIEKQGKLYARKNWVLEGVSVKDFTFSNKHNLWVATNKGVVYKNLITNESKYFTNENGFLEENIHALELVNDDEIWVSSDLGLSKISWKDFSVTNFNKSNGLWFDEFNFGASLLLTNGDAVFGGVNGLVYIDKVKKEIPINRSELVVSSISFLNPNTHDVTTNYFVPKNVNLDYFPDNKFVEVKFSVNDNLPSHKLKYEYKLSGYDENWVSSGRQGWCRFHDLREGKYALQLRALLPTGEWLYSKNNINIIAHDYFYNSWWFYMLVGILLAGVFTLAIRYRILQKLKLQKVRTQIASDLHDELGGVLTSIGLTSDLNATLTEDVQMKNHFLKINQLTQKAISGVSDVVWSVDSRNDNMLALKNRLQEFASNLLETKGIIFHLVLDNGVKELVVPLIVRQNLYLICKEIIHNCSKHCNGDKLEINIAKKGNDLVIHAKDNGSLFDDKKRLTGQGLQNIKMRAERIHASCQMNVDNGFHVSLKIPLK